MTEHYDLQNIRTLLTEGFSVEELRNLCFDTPVLKPVYEDWSASAGKGELARQIVDYSDKKLVIATVLNWAKGSNPDRYQKHQPYVITDAGSKAITTKGQLSKPTFLGRAWQAKLVVVLGVALALGAIIFGVYHSYSQRESALAMRATQTAMAIAVLQPSEMARVPTSKPMPTITPTPVWLSTQTPTLLATPTFTPSPCEIGRPPGNLQSFYIGQDYYHPSGIMGDIGDVNIVRDVGQDRFTYETIGREPHEWEYKYINGTPNPRPAQFAGVMYFDPPGNFGQEPGFDLRGIHRVLKWEARSVTGEITVEFIIGGAVWVWDEKERKRVSPSCPDSLRRVSLGMKKITESWQSFEYVLANIPEDNFKNVIGGFAWIIAWGDKVQLNPTATPPRSLQPKTFTIEIRNIRYER